MNEGFKKAKKAKKHLGGDISGVKFFWENGEEEGEFEIGENERRQKFHPWQSTVARQYDVIWQGFIVSENFCTFLEAWDALGRPDEFIINSGNGSLVLNANYPIRRM